MDVLGIAKDFGGPLAALFVTWVSMAVKAEIQALRLEMAEDRANEEKRRAAEKEDLRNWINGSFMRSAIVESRMNDIGRRLDALEE